MADITKPETMSLDIFNGVDCVIHAAAETGFSHFPPAEVMEEVNVNGICMVIINTGTDSTGHVFPNY